MAVRRSKQTSSRSRSVSKGKRAADTSERAYKAIRHLLVEFRLRPEERINERQLATSLNFSRTPVREALHRLASEGFCSIVPNKGFYARSPQTDELIQLFETRLIIETGAFRLACERADEESIAALTSFWNRALQGYDKRSEDEILELDESFHVQLAQLSGNPELVQLLERINARIRFVRRIQIELGPRHEGIVKFHARIVRALQQRKAEEGSRLLADHIAMTVDNARLMLKEALVRAYVPAAGAQARAVLAAARKA
jgi:DNA-binding GntR family transcriptional regulator